MTEYQIDPMRSGPCDCGEPDCDHTYWDEATEADAEVWSVYEKMDDPADRSLVILQWITDCDTRADAEAFVEYLKQGGHKP